MTYQNNLLSSPTYEWNWVLISHMAWSSPIPPPPVVFTFISWLPGALGRLGKVPPMPKDRLSRSPISRCLENWRASLARYLSWMLKHYGEEYCRKVRILKKWFTKSINLGFVHCPFETINFPLAIACIIALTRFACLGLSNLKSKRELVSPLFWRRATEWAAAGE